MEKKKKKGRFGAGLDASATDILSFQIKEKDVINPVRPPGNYELLPLICFPQIMLRRETTAVWILFISYISLTVV